MNLFGADTKRLKAQDRNRKSAEMLQAAAELANARDKKELTDTQMIELDDIVKHIEEGNRIWGKNGQVK